ncbi:MAG: TonB system transport protein ExbD [Pseudomonadota bacterium]
MKKFEQINVIPFIDIMLVLLAIVLTTATFIAQGKLQIELPQASQTQTLNDTPAIEISIDAKGTIYVDELATEIHSLDERLATLQKNQALALRVDGKADFERFVGVVDLLKKHGLDNLSIRTLKPTS